MYPVQTSVHGPGVQHARILVCDDDPGALGALRTLLHGQGFVVECAGDGQAALERAARFDPDVVLTDLHMPRLDGIELCEGLRKLDPTLPIILVTAHDDTKSILRGLRAGVDDYLTKPLDIELVLWSVRRAIGAHAARIEQEQARRHTQPLLVEALSAVKRYEEVLAIVAHDLRSPLAVIQLATKLLLDETRGSGSAQKLVGSITRSVARSNRIIENLFDEARLHGAGITLEYRNHRVETLLDDVGDLRPLALQRGIVLDIRPAPERATLSCDRAKVGQLLSNLVGNAIKFSPKGSTVTVWAEQVGGGVELAVRDQGPGISVDAQSHLFERFWQATGDSAVAGIGLGLYIAKGIVDAHGGEIRVASREGTGSTFFVYIPAEQPATSVAKASRRRTMTPGQLVQHASAMNER